MATYGNRPALYKPTDFSSQQKRLAAAVAHASSTSEVKKEEDKPTFKIQQRPILVATDQKTPVTTMEDTKTLTTSTTDTMSVDTNIVNPIAVADEKPGGVAQKDLDKIAKLKEFMAKQQTGEKEDPNKSIPADQHYVAPVLPIMKSNLLNGKIPDPVTTKIATSTSGKLFANKTLPSHESKIMNGEKNPPGIITGVLATKSSLITNQIKPSMKENKDPSDTTKDEKTKAKGQKDTPKDGKKKSSGGSGGGGSRGGINRNTKNSPISTVSAATTAKQISNDKSTGKAGKSKEMNQRSKQPAKASPNSSNMGARSKVITSKSQINNQRTHNEQNKNQHRQFDRSQMPGASSYYSQANKIPGFPNNELPPWLPYAMNTMNMNGGQSSILGQPQGPRVDFAPKPTVHHDKSADQGKNAVNGQPGQKKVVTVEATKDKSEQKKSLDFVKSFFDTDPEVQYNRKINAEKRNAATNPPGQQPPVSASGVTPTVAKDDSPAVSRHHLTNSSNSSANGSNSNQNHANNVNTHFSSHGGDISMSNHVNSHFNSHGDANNHFSSIADTHVGGHVNNYANMSHANTRLVNNTLNNSQVNNFVHSSPHIPGNIPGNHIPGAPGSHIPAGSHIPGSMASSYSSVYHHTNVSNMAAHNAAAALHPNPQSGHFQGSSTVSPVHMGATPTQLHPAISSHPSSLHHRQQTYDLYSQVNQINPLLTEPDRFIKYCSVMNNYPAGY